MVTSVQNEISFAKQLYKDPVEKYIFIVLGFALLLLIVISGESYFKMNSIIRDYDEASNANELFLQLKNLQAVMRESDNFFKESDEPVSESQFLSRQSELGSMMEFIPVLYRLSNRSEIQTSNVKLIESILYKKLDLARALMENHISSDLSAVALDSLRRENSLLSSELHSLISHFKLDENLNYQRLQKKSLDTTRQTITTISLGAFLVIVVIFFAMANIRIEISKRKRYTEELHTAHQKLTQNAQELEIVNQDLRQYANIVSHDIKAPLRAIKQYVRFLSEDLQGKLSQEEEKYMKNMEKALVQGERLVEDILKYSSIGMRKIKMQRVDLDDLISDVVESRELKADENIEFENGIPAIDSEPGLLRQIITNLIDNGLKFNNSSTKILKISWNCSGTNNLDIHIWDNGIGIDEKDFDFIFGAFQRLHPQSEFQGTGIGLSIVKKAVNRINGVINLKSSKGGGSHFTITLPLTS